MSIAVSEQASLAKARTSTAPGTAKPANDEAMLASVADLAPVALLPALIGFSQPF